MKEDVFDQSVIRDVVFFFHLQTGYATIEYDLPWQCFRLRYWDFLPGLPDVENGGDRRLGEAGCLLIILAAASAEAANISYPLGSNLEECREVISKLRLTDDDLERLRHAAQAMLELAATSQHLRDYNQITAIRASVDWAQEQIVESYFASRSRQMSERRRRTHPTP
jgi:hypothetical protein